MNDMKKVPLLSVKWTVSHMRRLCVSYPKQKLMTRGFVSKLYKLENLKLLFDLAP